MKGFKEDSKEYKALESFVKCKQLGLNPETTMSKDEIQIVENMVDQYSRGFIACEMNKIIENGIN